MKKIPNKDVLFVSVQFFLFGIYFFPLFDHLVLVNDWLKYAALVVAIFGAGIVIFSLLQLKTNLTAFPTPKENGTLVQEGLYRYMRHPIYGGIILTTVGYGLFTGSLWQISIGLILWVLFYFKSNYEEGLLLATYSDYENYKRKAGRFFPIKF